MGETDESAHARYAQQAAPTSTGQLESLLHQTPGTDPRTLRVRDWFLDAARGRVADELAARYAQRAARMSTPQILRALEGDQPPGWAGRIEWDAYVEELMERHPEAAEAEDRWARDGGADRPGPAAYVLAVLRRAGH